MLSDRIQTSDKKPGVTAKTIGQKHYLDAIRLHDVTFGVGPAGTGKTYLAVAMALAALRQGTVSRIILTRPAVEAGEALGFLPGDLYEKILPYLRPLHDALHDMLPAEEVQKHTERGSSRLPRWPICAGARSIMPSSSWTKPRTRLPNKCSCS